MALVAQDVSTFALPGPSTMARYGHRDRGRDDPRRPVLMRSASADSGADDRELLLAGAVTVNGARETRRGRQLDRGDMVAVGAQTVRVV
jgi:ribosome-associated protein